METVFVVMSESKMADTASCAFPNCFCLTMDEALEAKKAFEALRGKHFEFFIEEVERWNGKAF